MFNKKSSIFSELKKYTDIEDCYYLADYFPYSRWDEYKSLNQMDEIEEGNSRLIMDLKMDILPNTPEWKKEKKEKAISTIVSILEDLIYTNKDIYICTVPSSRKNNSNHGITLVAKKLCKYNKYFIDGTNIIKKTRDTPQLHGTKEYRNYNELSKSLTVDINLEGRDVLLLDDVITTGGSIRTVKELLLLNRVNSVCALSISKTF